jgi:hypothetical protein
MEAQDKRARVAVPGAYVFKPEELRSVPTQSGMGDILDPKLLNPEPLYPSIARTMRVRREKNE